MHPSFSQSYNPAPFYFPNIFPPQSHYQYLSYNHENRFPFNPLTRYSKQRSARAGRRKQRKVSTIVGHRPDKVKRPRPPSTLTEISINTSKQKQYVLPSSHSDEYTNKDHNPKHTDNVMTEIDQHTWPSMLQTDNTALPNKHFYSTTNSTIATVAKTREKTSILSSPSSPSSSSSSSPLSSPSVTSFCDDIPFVSQSNKNTDGSFNNSANNIKHVLSTPPLSASASTSAPPPSLAQKIVAEEEKLSSLKEINLPNNKQEKQKLDRDINITMIQNENNETKHQIQSIDILCGRRPQKKQRARPSSSLITVPLIKQEQLNNVEFSNTNCAIPPNNTTENSISDNNNPSRLKVIHLNAQSVRNKDLILHDYIVEKSPDIFVITESWLFDKGDESTIAQLIPTGYCYQWQNRTTVNRGGGILVIYKMELCITKIDSKINKSFEHIEFTFRYKNQMFRSIAIYRPDQRKKGIYINDFFTEFENFLIDIITKPGNLIFITGDFNIHVDNPNDPESKTFLELLDSFNLEQKVGEKTHVAGHILDLVITRKENKISTSDTKVVPFGLTVHHCVYFTVNIPKPPKIKKTVKYRNTRNINLNALKKSIEKSNLNDKINSVNNVSEQMEIFDKELKVIFDEYAPLKEKMFSPKPDCGWYTDKIREMKRDVRRTERRATKSKSCEDKKKLKELRNKMNKMLHKQKRMFIKNKIFENKGNSKEIFKITNNLMKPKTTNFLEDPDTLCEDFNKFFINKIKVIRDSLDKQTCDIKINSPHESHPKPNLMNFDIVTVEEIERIIKLLPPKSCASDPIPTWLLKDCSNILSPIIVIIVNNSINSGVFPSSLKHAIVTPIIKGQSMDKGEFKNYRPVSNIPVMSKIMEKIVNNRLSKYLHDNNLLPKFQSAYRKNHSTETALLKVLNDTRRIIDSKSLTSLTLLDLSAAFDTIDHQILIRRLRERFGIEGTALDWFASYIDQRTQSVLIDSSMSSSSLLRFGVPQGSILGPVLFTLYTSPLTDIIENHGLQYHLYADDTQLYLPLLGIDDEETIEKLQQCSSDIQNWMTNNKLKLNCDKTDMIILGNDKQLRSIENVNDCYINVCDSNVKISRVVKNLGVSIDPSLSMKIQVNRICQASIFHLKNIRKIRPFIDFDTTKLLINSLVTARLDYCNSLLIGLSQKYLSKLQQIQNNAARIITCKKKYDNISQTLQDLHWLPIKERIDFKVLCIVYKCLNDSAPQYLDELIKSYSPPRALRSNDCKLLEIPRSSTCFGDKAFSIYGPNQWNKLSEHCRKAKSYDSFRKSLKTFLYRRAYRSTNL